MDKIVSKLRINDISLKSKIIIGIFMLLSISISLAIVVDYIFRKYEWINVHLIPHSHDDVGWLQTPENYYTADVSLILDNVIVELQKNSTRKFVYVETYYFWKWWQEQSEEAKQIVRYLIRKKQLEIVGGGWCMSDEAVVHYQSFIDQSTWGFRRLNDTLGSIACPKIAWQIDTFGHSKGIASLFAQMGFDALFFARIDEDDRNERKKKKLMEFVWRASESLGQSNSIFTSVFFKHYSAPEGFDFEYKYFVDGLDFSEFSTFVRAQAKSYRTNHILVPMGDDFRYFYAKTYFESLDLLINFFKTNPVYKLNVFYSTPSLYLSSLYKADLTWPEKRGDFFPYFSEPGAFWTGFYTSRPTLKFFERITNNFLQVTKQLMVLSNLGVKFFNQVTTLREAVGVLQHHDAVTGTSQQHVAYHYSKLLHEGIRGCETPLNAALRKLSLQDETDPLPLYKICLLLNISSCEVTETAPRFIVTVYNPFSHRIDHYVRIPITGKQYRVRSGDGSEIESQIVGIPKFVRNIPGRKSSAKAELVFKVTRVPGLGFKSVYVSQEANPVIGRRSEKPEVKKPLKLIFHPKTHLLSGIITDSANISLEQSIRYYKSVPHSSGAYLFKPIDINHVHMKKEVETKLLNNGNLVKEYEQTFAKWAAQVIRIYKDEDHVEFDWVVGPIPIRDGVGKDVILVYKSNIDSGNIFYTDVNGMEMIKRVIEKGSLGKDLKGISGNYYPVTTMISINDKSSQMFVIIDRPQGGSSQRSGEVELMVHRRLCYDDGKGVLEALNETAFGTGLKVRGRHWVVFGSSKGNLYWKAKLFAQKRHSEPWLFFTDARSFTFKDWTSNFITEFSGLFNHLPAEVRILTLEPWREDTILLRLENIFDNVSLTDGFSAPVIFSFKNLFRHFVVIEARETTLGADRWLYESNRLKWKTKSKMSDNPYRNAISGNMTISLNPQEIRTFVLKIKTRT